MEYEENDDNGLVVTIAVTTVAGFAFISVVGLMLLVYQLKTTKPVKRAKREPTAYVAELRKQKAVAPVAEQLVDVAKENGLLVRQNPTNRREWVVGPQYRLLTFENKKKLAYAVYIEMFPSDASHSHNIYFHDQYTNKRIAKYFGRQLVVYD